MRKRAGDTKRSKRRKPEEKTSIEKWEQREKEIEQENDNEARLWATDRDCALVQLPKDKK